MYSDNTDSMELFKEAKIIFTDIYNFSEFRGETAAYSVPLATRLDTLIDTGIYHYVFPWCC